MRPGVLSFPLNDNIALAAACVSSAGAFTLVYPTPFVSNTPALPFFHWNINAGKPVKARLQIVVDDFRRKVHVRAHERDTLTAVARARARKTILTFNSRPADRPSERTDDRIHVVSKG